MRSLFEGKGIKARADEISRPTTKDNVFGQREFVESVSAPYILSNSFTAPQKLESGAQGTPAQVGIDEISPLPLHLTSQNLDVINRGIISMELATKLFRTYMTELVPHYPTVVFSPSVSAAEIRDTKPTLFLAIIAAASGKSDSHLYSILNSEVISAYAQRIVIGSQKSLELVQAMIVTSVWYYPPGKFTQLKFYEYIHMAATMAMDIGLGSNPKTLRRRWEPPISEDTMHGNYDEIEKRRTFLACYLMTTGQVEIQICRMKVADEIEYQ
jgi:hypothetical protein